MNVQENQSIATTVDKPAPQKTSAGKVMSVMALLIALLAVVSSVYVCWQLNMAKQQFHQQEILLEKNSDILNQQSSILKTVQQESQQLVQKNQQQLAIDTLPRVNHLLKLAAFYLTFENDPASARQLLEIADQEIGLDQNMAFLPLHKALTQNITLLNAATVDVSSIIMRIGLLSEQVEKLPELPITELQAPSTTPAIPPKPTQTQAVLDQVKSIVFAAGHALGNMVVISTDNKTAPLLLTSQQQLYLMTNIQSQLTLAQWAAIQRNEGVYKQTLTQVFNWLTRYFPVGNPLVVEMLNAIKDLRSININPPVPNILESLNALQQVNK